MGTELKLVLDAVLNKLDTIDAKIDGLVNDNILIRTEMNEFKNEMYEFKNEMYEFKNEMYEFKSEMNEFRKETNEGFDHIDRQLRFFDVDLQTMNKEVADNKREIKRLKHA